MADSSDHDQDHELEELTTKTRKRLNLLSHELKLLQTDLVEQPLRSRSAKFKGDLVSRHGREIKPRVDVLAKAVVDASLPAAQHNHSRSTAYGVVLGNAPGLQGKKTPTRGKGPSYDPSLFVDKLPETPLRGLRVEFCDRGTWYPVTVRKWRQRAGKVQVYIHFDGWAERHNRWALYHPDVLKPRRTADPGSEVVESGELDVDVDGMTFILSDQPLDCSHPVQSKSNTQQKSKSTDKGQQPKRKAQTSQNRSHHKKSRASPSVTDWTISEVQSFVEGIPGCAQYGSVFQRCEIDGASLLLLTEQHLTSPLMGVALGPALKIVAAVREAAA